MSKYADNFVVNTLRERRIRQRWWIISLCVGIAVFFVAAHLLSVSSWSASLKNRVPKYDEHRKVLGTFSEQIAALGGVATLAVEGAPYVDFLNKLVGQQGEDRRYLLVFQNNAELRPTGGFMGSYAEVHVADGRVRDVRIPGGGLYDLEAGDRSSVRAPQPFFLFSPRWRIWNANWFPDFPTSAENIIWFYDKAGGPTIDGVITLQPSLIERILAVSGPITLPEFGVTIDADTFFEIVQQYVETGYDKEKNAPKEIIGALAAELSERLLAHPTPETMLQLLHILIEEAQLRRIMMYFRDTAAQSFVVEHGWDGALQPYDKDYLHLSYANIGGGKSDRVTRSRVEVTVLIHRDGSVEHSTRVTRRHYGSDMHPIFGLPNVDFLRVYTRKGATLTSAQGFDTIPPELFKKEEYMTLDDGKFTQEVEDSYREDEKTNTHIADEVYMNTWGGRREYTSFGNWMIVDPEKERTAEFSYFSGYRIQMPSMSFWQRILRRLGFGKPRLSEYELVIQKQPGVDTDLWKVKVVAERGFSLIPLSDKTPDEKTSSSATWVFDSREDQVIRVGVGN